MASVQPQFLGLTLLVVYTCFALATFPRLLPNLHVVISIGTGIFALWKLWLYPVFFDHLRHIPGPKARPSLCIRLQVVLTMFRVVSLSFATN